MYAFLERGHHILWLDVNSVYQHNTVVRVSRLKTVFTFYHRIFQFTITGLGFYIVAALFKYVEAVIQPEKKSKYTPTMSKDIVDFSNMLKNRKIVQEQYFFP